MTTLLRLWVAAVLLLAAAASGQGILIPVSFYPVQNAPFALTIQTDWERPGRMGPTQGQQKIFRDSAGRQRYEALVVNGTASSDEAHIYDVVSGKIIELNASAKTAVISPMRVGRVVDIDTTVASSLPPADGQNLLGMKKIAGLEAWGRTSQTTTTRPDGSTLTTDREVWISTHYRMPVQQVIETQTQRTTQTVVTFDPREPDAALFQIPPGYTVSDAPPPPEPAPGTVRVGGNVSAPRVLSQAEPEFSDEARRLKIDGDVLVYLVVDENGLPQNIKVVKGIGHGLDEKAVEAVKRYRFKPAMRDGQPVKVELHISVNFQIFGKRP